MKAQQCTQHDACYLREAIMVHMPLSWAWSYFQANACMFQANDYIAVKQLTSGCGDYAYMAIAIVIGSY